MSRIFDWVSDLIFPNRCAFCGGFIPWNELACEKCAAALERADFCQKCGKAECECGDREFYYDGCATLFPYIGAARSGVLALKYHNGFNTAKYMMPELSERVKAFGFTEHADIITAVPMSKQRRRQTGYNHAEYIAKLLAKQLNIPLDFKLIQKGRTDIIQHELTAEERRSAVVGAYREAAKHADISGKTIILCDDIITTGSTLSECARILKSMGARKVYCAVLAGTVRSDANDSK